jgi:Uma2 family endonuclease
VAPVDVQIDKDERTMVEPDIVVLCDKHKIVHRCIFGVPDFVVEVLSKSTRKKDLTVKPHKYSEAGVKEYWLIDCDKEDNSKVIVYDFAHGDTVNMYTFDDKVPVGISEWKCFVDFSKVKKALDFDLPEEPPEGWR